MLIKTYIKVYSHPRSGTHFLEAFLGRNFYNRSNLHTKANTWGHWCNRKQNSAGNPYGKLFGHHHFPTFSDKKSRSPMIYIYRDPRAVAYSVWKTENFIHKKYNGMSFSDFLRLKLDWQGTPANKCVPEFTIGEHWREHVSAWHNLQKSKKNLLIIRYEDLKDIPDECFRRILETFFRLQSFFIRTGLRGIPAVDPIAKPVGLLPNTAQKEAWKEIFTDDDEKYLLNMIGDCPYLIRN